MIKFACFLFCFLFVISNLHSAVWAQNLTSRSAIIVDQSSNKVVFEKNIFEKLLPASTTKLMTALVVLKHLPLQKKLIVSKKAFDVEPVKAYLSVGCKYTVEELLHAILMMSSNDAAIVLAEGVAETEENFASLMTKEARKIGAVNTKFANASGLPSQTEQYTTMLDLTKIMAEVMKKPVLMKILNTQDKVIVGDDGKPIKIINKNKFLTKYKISVVGKTGYTDKAGLCFVGYRYKDEENPGVIFGILKGERLWEELIYLLGLKY